MTARSPEYGAGSPDRGQDESTNAITGGSSHAAGRSRGPQGEPHGPGSHGETGTSRQVREPASRSSRAAAARAGARAAPGRAYADREREPEDCVTEGRAGARRVPPRRRRGTPPRRNLGRRTHGGGDGGRGCARCAAMAAANAQPVPCTGPSRSVPFEPLQRHRAALAHREQVAGAPRGAPPSRARHRRRGSRPARRRRPRCPRRSRRRSRRACRSREDSV